MTEQGFIPSDLRMLQAELAELRHQFSKIVQAISHISTSIEGLKNRVDESNERTAELSKREIPSLSFALSIPDTLRQMERRLVELERRTK